PRPTTALDTPGVLEQRLDHHHDQGVGLVVDSQDTNIRQADKKRAHTRRVALHRGSEDSTGVRTVDSPGPCAATGGPPLPPPPALRSEAPVSPPPPAPPSCSTAREGARRPRWPA